MQSAPIPQVPAVVSPLSTYLNLASAACFVLFIAYSIVRAILNKHEDNVAVHVSRALAAAQLPSAVVLIYAGFDPSVLAHLSGLNIGLVVAGVVLGWISVKQMIIAPATETALAKPEPQQGAER